VVRAGKVARKIKNSVASAGKILAYAAAIALPPDDKWLL